MRILRIIFVHKAPASNRLRKENRASYRWDRKWKQLKLETIAIKTELYDFITIFAVLITN